MGILSSLGKGIAKGLDYISAPLSQPITFITKGPTAAATKVAESRANIAAGKESGLKSIGTILTTTGVLATGVLAAGGAAGAGVAGSVARTIVTSKPVVSIALGTGALAVAAPETLSAIASKPEVAKVAVAAAVNPVLGIVAGLEQGVSLIGESVKSNEGALKVAGGVASAALLAGAGIYLGDKFLGENKIEGVLGTNDLLPSENSKVVATNTAIPQTPETTKISTGTNSRRSKKRRTSKPNIQNISQKVNVVVSNSQNKRYLKALVY